MHSRRRPRARTLVTLACLAGVVPVAASGASATAASYTATAAGSCSLSTKEQIKPKGGYFQSLKATGLGCSSAKKVMKHHDACRTKSSLKGKCAKVDGYSCSEKRGAAIATEFSSIVTCKKGSKKVVYSYQQSLE